MATASPARPVSTPVPRRGPGDRAVILTAGVGMFLSTLDTGIVNIALPSLQQELATDVTSIAWAVTLYLMTLSVTIVAFGRLGDRLGRVAVYRSGLLVFTLGSSLCGFAGSVDQLLLFRTVQGIGAAMVQATAAALITTFVRPERRGAALGTLGVILGLGPILGPTAGGLLLSTVGWRWLFWINVPFCLAGLWGCRRLTRARGQDRAARPIGTDLPGNLLLAGAVYALLQGLAWWPTLGAASPGTVAAFALSAVLFGLFLLRERSADEPLLDLRLFQAPVFATAFLAWLGFGVAAGMVFLIPPYFLEQVSHLAPWQVGLIAFAGPLGLVLPAQFSGSLAPRLGAGRLMAAGLALMLLAVLGLSTLREEWPPLAVAALLLLWGLGGGVFIPPNMLVLLSAVGEDLQGTIGAAQRMMLNVANALGAAAAAALMAAHTAGGVGLVAAFRASWRLAALVIALNLAGLLWTALGGRSTRAADAVEG
jgi:EmrB/QacA subfamily drug resistance transporter